MLVFLSVIENIVALLSIFSVVFAHAHVVLLTTQKSHRAEKKIHNARSLQENNARSAANQSARTTEPYNNVLSLTHFPSLSPALITCLIPFQDLGKIR